MGLMPLARFAEMQGVSRRAASNWVRDGRITVARRDGRRIFVDAAQARAELKSSEQISAEVDGMLEEDVQPEASGMTLNQAKLQTEQERAATLRLQRLEREGKLKDRDEVTEEAETAARIVRQGIDAIPTWASDVTAAALEGGERAVRKMLKEKTRQLEETAHKAMMQAAQEIEAERFADEVDAA